LDDHYAILLDPSAQGVVNPWTGATLTSTEVPGWDACHIFTPNTLAILDMVGMELGLNPKRVKTDIQTAAARCLQEYGCAHTDYATDKSMLDGVQAGMVGVGGNPGWISMNMLRDIAAAYRGIDLLDLIDRYWEWQVATNTQQPCMFFETFGGNNLCFYPRGVAIWGLFDALSGLVIDKVAGIDRVRPETKNFSVPRLLNADWCEN
jgi:xylan 1,4-beta-xylosidase